MAEGDEKTGKTIMMFKAPTLSNSFQTTPMNKKNGGQLFIKSIGKKR